MKYQAENDDFPARKYAKKKLHQFSYLDKLKIVHNVLVNKETQKDTAKTFRVTNILVSRLILQVKKNPKFLDELKFEIESKQEKTDRIKRAAFKILEKNKEIYKSDEVKALLKTEYGQESSNL